MVDLHDRSQPWTYGVAAVRSNTMMHGALTAQSDSAGHTTALPPKMLRFASRVSKWLRRGQNQGAGVRSFINVALQEWVPLPLCHVRTRKTNAASYFYIKPHTHLHITTRKFVLLDYTAIRTWPEVVCLELRPASNTVQPYAVRASLQGSHRGDGDISCQARKGAFMRASVFG